MTKKFAVDVEASLGYEANGRVKPARKKDIARLTIKQFVCSECGNVIELAKKSFGEVIICPECQSPMYQQKPV